MYVSIVKKLKGNITKSKYYETANLKTGGLCWNYIAHLIERTDQEDSGAEVERRPLVSMVPVRVP